MTNPNQDFRWQTEIGLSIQKRLQKAGYSTSKMDLRVRRLRSKRITISRHEFYVKITNEVLNPLARVVIWNNHDEYLIKFIYYTHDIERWAKPGAKPRAKPKTTLNLFSKNQTEILSSRNPPAIGKYMARVIKFLNKVSEIEATKTMITIHDM